MSLPYRRRTFYVHPIQRKYFSLSLVPLTLCAFLLVFLVFVPLTPALWGSAPDPETAATLEQVYALGLRIWPALLISMAISGVLSFFVTHKFAGPVYRFQHVLRRVAEGDLTPSARIRRGDDLQEFAGLLDRAVRTITSALTGIREQQALADKELAALQEKGKAGVNGEILQGLERIGRHHREVENILANFRLPTLEAPNPEGR